MKSISYRFASRTVVATFAPLFALAASACVASACVADLPGTTNDAGADTSTGAPDAGSTDAGSGDKDAVTSLPDAAPDSPENTPDASLDGPLSVPDAATDSAAPDAKPTFGLDTLPGLVLWVRVDRGVQLAGSRVTAWRDQSGHANDLTVGTTAPVLATTGGVSSVDFDGQTQFLVNGSALGIADGGARTMIVVARPKSASGRAPFLAQVAPPSTGINDYIIEANTATSVGDRYGLFLNGSSYDSDQPTTAPKFGIHVLRVDVLLPNDPVANFATYRLNGASATLALRYGSGVTGTVPAPTETILGAIDLGGGYIYGASSILEAAIWNRGLADAEIAKAEADIKSRYGL
jgi:hypothetical protein